jgi:L-ribulose-5-phosphate 3-epimerase
MTRRELLAGAGAAAALTARAAQPPLDRSRIAVVDDEAGAKLADAIVFAKQFGLQWLELRGTSTPDGYQVYERMPTARVKECAKQLSDAGVRVSFLNSALLKFALPGTTPVKVEDYYLKLYARLGYTDESLYKERLDNLKRAVEAAHILGVKQIRSFTYWRVKEPRAVFPRLVDEFHRMIEVAKPAGVRILIETEFATNMATSEETADLMKLLPSQSIGINWDPQNGEELEIPFPDGYSKLPKKRIFNVQMKYQGLLGTKHPLDWAAIFRTMQQDGYAGTFGLETHFGGGPRNYEASGRCMKEIFKRLGEAAA